MPFYSVREIEQNSSTYKMLEFISSGPKSSVEIANHIDVKMTSINKILHRHVHHYKTIQVSGVSDSGKGYLYRLSPIHGVISSTKVVR